MAEQGPIEKWLERAQQQGRTVGSCFQWHRARPAKTVKTRKKAPAPKLAQSLYVVEVGKGKKGKMDVRFWDLEQVDACQSSPRLRVCSFPLTFYSPDQVHELRQALLAEHRLLLLAITRGIVPGKRIRVDGRLGTLRAMWAQQMQRREEEPDTVMIPAPEAGARKRSSRK